MKLGRFALAVVALGLLQGTAFAQISSYPGNVVGTVGGACNSAQLNYGWPDVNGNTIQCVSNVWTALLANTPSAFTFTNQTNVATSTTISSNAVTLSGFTGTISATCGTGCTAIARNGTWGGTTVAGFQSGDTIAIRQTSSSSVSTTTNATVTAGSTTSGTWAVTTTSNTPSAFSFTNVTGANTAQGIVSNTVTLSGFTGSMTAVCGTGCINIAHNGAWGGTTVTGFASGDTIAIMQTSSSSVNTATTASVTVGNTVSGTWQVTTGSDCCPGVSTIGGACPDGYTVYAGITTDGTGAKMCTMPCDLGQSLVSSSCSGTRTTVSWNNGSTNYQTTGVTSQTAGKTNTATLITLTSNTDYPYKAAADCVASTYGGYSNWYLPSQQELVDMVLNYSAIGGFGATSTFYWSSSENALSGSWYVLSTTASTTATAKTSAMNIRCVRHN
jgi:Protein of unknown function (DUF1566)